MAANQMKSTQLHFRKSSRM